MFPPISGKEAKTFLNRSPDNISVTTGHKVKCVEQVRIITAKTNVTKHD